MAKRKKRKQSKKDTSYKVELKGILYLLIAIIGCCPFGIVADLVPAEFRAEGLIAELQGKVAGKKILIARAEVARDILPRELEKLGADVTVAKRI